MAGRFVNPLPQFMDATPTMLSGAKIFFYASGTSTKQNTYSDSGLTSANTNPVVLNSAGRLPNDVFLQDFNYKVVLAPATDSDPPSSPIWTADPVNARDSKLIAKTLTGSGSPSGVVAGTAGSASILPDFYWDYTNSILYVCTTTGTTSTAVWTAVNASAATPAVPFPQGRLTLTSATPVLVTDTVSATAVLYTPYVGTLVPIYNGSSMIPTEFSELTLTLSANHSLNVLYDVFVFSNSGVLTLATGPAWTTSTAGSGTRGTGAGTTQLSRVKGLYVNSVAMTGRNGATTYSIGANLATYLGTIVIDGTAGQVTCHTSWGQSRNWGVWNAYNRTRIEMKVGDGTASYTPSGVRPANNNTANSMRLVVGLPEEIVDLQFTQELSVVTNSNASSTAIAIGWDSTSSIFGVSGQLGHTSTIASNQTIVTSPTAKYIAVATIGAHVATALEGASTNSRLAFGTEALMTMTGIYLG